MTKKDRTTWGHQIQYFSVPSLPTKWELFLEKQDIQEVDVLSILHTGDSRSSKIREWIKSHHRTSFVPEKVLEVVGLTESVYFS